MRASLIAGSLGLLVAGRIFAADAAKGKESFEGNCAVCHNADSEQMKVGPGLKGLYKRPELVNKKNMTDANVAALINEGGNAMPPFADILSKAEKDGLIAYLKTL